jgi:hypothetical protein
VFGDVLRQATWPELPVAPQLEGHFHVGDWPAQRLRILGRSSEEAWRADILLGELRRRRRAARPNEITTVVVHRFLGPELNGTTI